MRVIYSLLFGGKSPKPVVVDERNTFIPMPKGFVSGFIRMTDDNHLMVEQEGKPPLIWDGKDRKWKPNLEVIQGGGEAHGKQS